MMVARPLLDEISSALLSQFPTLDGEERRVATRLYRMLACGRPVSPWRLAARLHLPVARIEHLLGHWPGISRGVDRSIEEFWGLSARPTPHRFLLGGRRLHTGCAWDGLFLPRVLGRTACILSRCSWTGLPVRLTVAPEGIRSVAPAEIVMSFVTPEAAHERENVLLRFCEFVQFFVRREAAARWASARKEVLVLSLDEAFELGRRRVLDQFGAAALEAIA